MLLRTESTDQLIEKYGLDNRSIIKEIEIESFDDLRSCLFLMSQMPKYKNRFVFRGTSDATYSLVPSILRNANQFVIKEFLKHQSPQGDYDSQVIHINAEFSLLRYYFNLCDFNGLRLPDSSLLRNDIARQSRMTAMDAFSSVELTEWIPNELLDIAALAQHFGLPTRLLDWTYDYKVALYFASKNALQLSKSNTGNIALWAINQKFFAALQKDNIDSPLSNKIKSPLIFFRPPYSGNSNLAAQKGILSIWKVFLLKYPDSTTPPKLITVDRSPYEEKIPKYFSEKFEELGSENSLLIKFILKQSEAKNVLRFLDEEGYNATTLFPGYYSIAEYIKNESIIHFPEVFYN